MSSGPNLVLSQKKFGRFLGSFSSQNLDLQHAV
jgi:hypothetical protein